MDLITLTLAKNYTDSVAISGEGKNINKIGRASCRERV